MAPFFERQRAVGGRGKGIKTLSMPGVRQVRSYTAAIEPELG